MKLRSFQRITRALETALKELEKLGLRDTGLRHRFAEFYVARELAKRGHDVQVLSEREDTSADIYLADIQKRVEVKSCKAYDTKGQVDWAYASFGDGNQISRKRFDYCIFVIFDKEREGVRRSFVFNCAELRQVARKRSGLATFEDSNPCLLVCAPNWQEYGATMKKWRVETLPIERSLCCSPNKYLDAWARIK